MSKTKDSTRTLTDDLGAPQKLLIPCFPISSSTQHKGLIPPPHFSKNMCDLIPGYTSQNQLLPKVTLDHNKKGFHA